MDFSWGEAFWNALVVVAIMGGAVLAGSFLAGQVANALERTGLDPMVRRLLARAVRPVLLIVGTVAAIQYLSIDVTPVTAMLGAATLAVGMSLQGTLSNVASGTMLLSLRPYREGDVVTAAGKTGTVVEQGYFRLTLRTPDGVVLSLPNTAVFGGSIDNLTQHGQRRAEVVFTLDFGADTEKALAVLTESLQGLEGVLETPAPAVALTDVGPRGPVVAMRAWAAGADLGAVKARMGHAGLKALRSASLPLAPPPMS